MMGLTKRQAQRPYQPVSQIGRSGKPRICCPVQRRAIGGHIANHANHRRQRQHQVVCGVKHLFFVFLHIFGISQRQTFHDRHQRHICAENPADLGTDQFGRVRIALLRHDRRAGRPLI